jgi:hypothetical protein
LVEPQKPVVQQTNYAETYGSSKKQQSATSVRPMPQNPNPNPAAQTAPVKRPNPVPKGRGPSPYTSGGPKTRGPAVGGPKKGICYTFYIRCHLYSATLY